MEILLHSLPHNGAAGHPWFFDPIKLQVPKKWELFQGGGNRVSATDNSLLGTISFTGNKVSGFILDRERNSKHRLSTYVF
ncbi:MAG: hypothetical protein R8G60_09925 [Roseovarius pacificus]|nr:hypothetical protein [Roseovarius pacificus]